MEVRSCSLSILFDQVNHIFSLNFFSCDTFSASSLLKSRGHKSEFLKSPEVTVFGMKVILGISTERMKFFKLGTIRLG